ncbi:MAG: hypothetical protein LC110_14560 [Burkholderiales bacterium]|nr:hypothetical protein [Burkholderiales bacterium]
MNQILSPYPDRPSPHRLRATVAPQATRRFSPTVFVNFPAMMRILLLLAIPLAPFARATDVPNIAVAVDVFNPPK